MIPVEAHLVLNHLPIIGLVFGLVFLVAGLRRSSDPTVRAGVRVLLAMAIAVLPVVASGWVAAKALAEAAWLDPDALSWHRLAGVLTLAAYVGLGGLCGAVLLASRGAQAISPRAEKAVLAVAIVALACALWTAYLGGGLRHDELGRSRHDSTVPAAARSACLTQSARP